MNRRLVTGARRLIELLAATWKLETDGRERIDQLRRQGIPLLYAVWHGQLLPALFQHRGDGTLLMISAHRDGGYLADAARAWGFHSVRGSSTRGGARALRGIVAALRSGQNAAMAPDGPRGPARVAKPGTLWAARHSGAAVIPVATATRRPWRMASWDRFLIPRAFARVVVAYGEPLFPVAGRSEEADHALQAALNRTAERAECLV